MKKVLGLAIPFIGACLMLGMTFYLVTVSSQVMAAPLPSTPTGEILVTTLDDELNNDGDCSLREAIAAANNNNSMDACPVGNAVITDTITFDVSGIITVTSQLSVTAGGPLVIDGSNVVTTSGGGTTRVWWIEEGSSLTLKNLAVVKGHSDNGAGLFNNIADVTIRNCTFLGNEAGQGGIYNLGTLTIANSTFYNNHATGIGGGIVNASTMTTTNSTFSGNSADMYGGAISNWGSLYVHNSTITNNICNYSCEGGGIHSWSGSNVLKNDIIANNHAWQFGDCKGVFTDEGHNLDSDGTCGLDPAKGSMSNTDPLLGSLQDNGGSTWTHALLPLSPAIDAGEDVQCPPTDQRGAPRPIDGNGDGLAVCDIGSFEVSISPSLVTISGASEGLLGQVTYFTATVEPISTTLPLEYVWKTSGHPPITETMGLTDTVGWAWEVPGIQGITVTASNIGGSVTDTHVIIITDIPISGLVASNDSPTLLGSVTTLTATVTSGSNIIYSWDFGDGEVGGGMVVTHTYSDVGIFTATVTAGNSANMLTADTNVTITSTIQSFYLPLVIKSIEAPLAPAPSSSLPGSMVLVGLVVFGATISWMRRM